MTEKLRECPFCGGEARLKRGAMNGCYFVECSICKIGTEIRPGKEGVSTDWNTRTADENPPLTLDEIREPMLYRQPVWIQGSEQRFSGWAIVGATFDDYDKQVAWYADGLNASHYMKDYGKTWLAYRRKLEEAQE